MKKITLAIVLLASLNNIVFAQSSVGGNEPKSYVGDINQIFPSAPTSNNLMKFEEVPISYYTGIPDISIPLISIPTNNSKIAVGVQLKYHPLNAKPDDKASETGLGWSFIAGGTISRTVRGGNPDEKNRTIAFSSPPKAKYGIYNETYNPTSTLMKDQTIDLNNYGFEAAMGRYDTEYDLYQYNFMGQSGRFYIVKDDVGNYKPEKLDKNNLQIIINNTAPNDITSFTIVDDKGIRYTFEGMEKSQKSITNVKIGIISGIGNPNPSLNIGNYWAAFNLTKIEDPNNILLANFNYTIDSAVKFEETPTTIKRLVMNVQYVNTSGNTGISDGSMPGAFETQYVYNTTNTKLLTSIDVIGKGTIYLNYEKGREDSNYMEPSQLYKLKSIQSNYIGQNIQQYTDKYVLDYGYSNTALQLENGTTKALQKLMLTKVTKISPNAQNQEYNLDYYTVSGDLQKDKWGYYTGTNEAYKADVLKTLTYPTKGKVVFDFGDTDTDKVITENFTYDPQNRLLSHTHQVDNNPVEYLAQNSYNELSQLSGKKVGGISPSAPLQDISYSYNIRGWMTKINDPANLNGKLFGYKINYNQVEGLETPDALTASLQVKPKYNGNIAEVSWKTLTEENEPLKRYGYVYDRLNRLSAGFYQRSGQENSLEYFEKAEYDLNGNITRLKRSEGLVAGSTTAMMIDNLKYDYTGNRLTKVTEEQIGNSKGYPYIAVPNEIQYDNGLATGNGNITAFVDKGISSIQYNYLNLPKKITQNTKVTDYIYRADGTKVKKLFGDVETNYLDGFQYKSTKPSEAGSGGGPIFSDPNEVAVMKLRIIPTSEGYFDALNNQYIYNYTDHLGNVRLSYSDTNKDGIIQPRQYHFSQCDGPWDPFNPPNCIDYWKPGEIVEVNNYYPFGLLHNYTAISGNAYQYKYNGKELQETGMYDYGARMYMPDIGRWGVVDQLAETSRRWSTYTYAYNNPIRFIDPDGMQAEDKIKIFNNGKIERTKDNNTYDTVTNEDESKSIKIARTNVTENNPTGDSQIRDAKTVPYNTGGHEGVAGGTEFTYMQIQDYDVATQVFEFAADNTVVEFGQDTFSFSDGFSTNIVGTNHSINESASASDVLENNNLGGTGYHITKDAVRQERVHSHPPGSEWGPSGFDVSRNNKTGELTLQRTFLNPVGDRKAHSPSVGNTYQYTPRVGYFKYNKDTAKYTGKTKN